MYIHSYYGLIWQKDGKYISCNIIEETYGSNFIDVFLFDKIPHGNKLTFKEYDLIDRAIKWVFENYGFNCNTLVNYTRNGFAYIASNEKTQCLLQLKDNNLACYFSDVSPVDSVTQKLTPNYYCKKSVNLKNIETITNAAEQSFSEAAKRDCN